MRRTSMRHVVWSIVAGSIIGVLLGAGAAGAQPFRGGLPACVNQLSTCKASLGKCQTGLTACLAEPNVGFPGDGQEGTPLDYGLDHGPALSYTDHHDGTFTDTTTLLMWETKDSAGGIHDVNTAYTWSGSGEIADGTLFTVFLATLNTAPCFAGHCDWRIPTVKELQSLVDYSRTNPASSVPDAAVASFNLYWSATSDASAPSYAWYVDFTDGVVSPGYALSGKKFSLCGRAVRGGR